MFISIIWTGSALASRPGHRKGKSAYPTMRPGLEANSAHDYSHSCSLKIKDYYQQIFDKM